MLWIQDAVATHRIRFHYVPTERNPADLMTKVVPRNCFDKLQGLMGLRKGPRAIQVGDSDIEQDSVDAQQAGQQPGSSSDVVAS
jgi:hypothetical protein